MATTMRTISSSTTISHPDMIYYVCVAKGTTILAEFNTKDSDLQTLASRCLERAPKNHAFFSHTVRSRSYTFLIDEPNSFAYFSIYDHKLELPTALSFLKNVQNAFDKIHPNSEASKFTSRCFQGEFNAVFHQLLAPRSDNEAEAEAPRSPTRGAHKVRGMPMLSPRGLKVKKKKRFGNGDSREGLFENKLDLSDSREIVLNRDLSVSMMQKGSGGLYENSSSSHRAAKRVWKRHVWVVLTLDLVLCLILFGVWLWICRGFKCIDG